VKDHGEGRTSTKVAAAIAPLASLMSQPLVAALTGAGVGLASFFVSRASARLVAPDDPTAGFVRLAFVSTVRMLIMIVALAGFFYLASSGFIYFSLSLIGAFMLSLGYEVYRADRAQRAARG
jgi:hypothetical protein